MLEYTKGVIVKLFDCVPRIFYMNTECKGVKVEANLIAEKYPFPNITWFPFLNSYTRN